MKVIDIFSGCGGFSIGFQQAGFTVERAIEIDDNACDTYADNIGLEPVRQDISELKRSDFGKADILIGGFPCQPFSLSGLQRGFQGTSGEGFNSCLTAIESSQPSVFVLENVAGFLKLHGGVFLKIALRELEKLGYECQVLKLNAENFGIPQKRERVFIIGNNIDAGAISMQQYQQPSLSVRDAIDDLVGKEYNLNNHEPMRHSQRIVARFAATKPGECTRDAMDRDPSLGTAKITKQCYRRLVANEPAPTLVANFVTTTIHYSQNRNITAREGARIQSFPDDFKFHGLKTRMSWQRGLSQFEQIGNAVPPKLAKLLGIEVKMMLDGRRKTKKNTRLHHSLVDDLDSEYEHVMTKIRNKALTGGKRGRKSKYQYYYSYLENCNAGESIELPASLKENVKFIETAMRRRNINISIVEKSGKTYAVKLS